VRVHADLASIWHSRIDLSLQSPKRLSKIVGALNGW
jgi:hypothetical protein